MSDAAQKLDNLASALVEDILKAPGEEMLLEALEDRLRTYRDRISFLEARLTDARSRHEISDEQVKRMVDRFLMWKLPADFSPDDGISFDAISSRGTSYERVREPVGTNLLTATQAEAMVRFMVTTP